MSQAAEYIPRPGEYDPLASDVSPADAAGDEQPRNAGATVRPGVVDIAPVLRVLSLSEVRDYEPPPGSLIVGDSVIELGEIALLYGPPGSYKGFAVGSLMGCGAWGYGEWLGHSVQAQFASLWLNCENGRRRLRDQFRKMVLPDDAERFIHITDIPAVWSLADARLAGEIRRTLVEKEIRVLVVDTVSNFVADEFAKEFAAFFACLNALLHGMQPKPAVLLIHHSRKPKEADRGGRGLLNLISGHQMLQRRARSICYLGRVTDDFNETRTAAVWLKVSNNGEAEGSKTALQLAEDATLIPIPDFDWSIWEGAAGSGSKREPKVSIEHLRTLFEFGKRKIVLKHAAKELEELAGVGRSAAYEALKCIGGRFSNFFVRDPDTALITLRATDAEDAEVD